MNQTTQNLIDALEDALDIVHIYTSKLEDDGAEQDHIISNIITPAMDAIKNARGE